MDDAADGACQLCLTADSEQFMPCPCNYQVCAFCYDRLKQEDQFVCPACRKPYDEKNIQYMPLSQEQIATQRRKKREHAKENKAKSIKTIDTAQRKQLEQMKVIKMNNVYMPHVPSRLADENAARTYFGRFGDIKRLSFKDNERGSTSLFLAFERDDDARMCIIGTDGKRVDTTDIKAMLALTRYCPVFLNNEECNKHDCPNVHQLADDDHHFTPDQIVQNKQYELYGGKGMKAYEQKLRAAAAEKQKQSQATQGTRPTPLSSVPSMAPNCAIWASVAARPPGAPSAAGPGPSRAPGTYASAVKDAWEDPSDEPPTTAGLAPAPTTGPSAQTSPPGLEDTSRRVTLPSSASAAARTKSPPPGFNQTTAVTSVPPPPPGFAPKPSIALSAPDLATPSNLQIDTITSDASQLAPADSELVTIDIMSLPDDEAWLVCPFIHKHVISSEKFTQHLAKDHHVEMHGWEYDASEKKLVQVKIASEIPMSEYQSTERPVQPQLPLSGPSAPATDQAKGHERIRLNLVDLLQPSVSVLLPPAPVRSESSRPITSRHVPVIFQLLDDDLDDHVPVAPLSALLPMSNGDNVHTAAYHTNTSAPIPMHQPMTSNEAIWLQPVNPTREIIWNDVAPAGRGQGRGRGNIRPNGVSAGNPLGRGRANTNVSMENSTVSIGVGRRKSSNGDDRYSHFEPISEDSPFYQVDPYLNDDAPDESSLESDEKLFGKNRLISSEAVSPPTSSRMSPPISSRMSPENHSGGPHTSIAFGNLPRDTAMLPSVAPMGQSLEGNRTQPQKPRPPLSTVTPRLVPTKPPTIVNGAQQHKPLPATTKGGRPPRSNKTNSIISDGPLRPPNAISAKQIQHNCPVCNQLFMTRAIMDLHIGHKHPQQAESINESQTEAPPS